MTASIRIPVLTLIANTDYRTDYLVSIHKEKFDRRFTYAMSSKTVAHYNEDVFSASINFAGGLWGHDNPKMMLF